MSDVKIERKAFCTPELEFHMNWTNMQPLCHFCDKSPEWFIKIGNKKIRSCEVHKLEVEGMFSALPAPHSNMIGGFYGTPVTIERIGYVPKYELPEWMKPEREKPLYEFVWNIRPFEPVKLDISCIPSI